MRHSIGQTSLQYALLALLVFAVAVPVLVYVLWPTLQMILDGFQILSQAFNGTFVPLK